VTGIYRRTPKITDPGYIHLHKLSKLFKESVEKYLSKNTNNLMILDVGCGEKPYQAFFKGRYLFYIGIDITKKLPVDILCYSERLPFKFNCFDVCVCTQVLEHVEKPELVVSEISRTLKPGGFLFASTHGNWPVHDFPHDYHRWTDEGLRKLLNAFSKVEVYECPSPIASIIQLINIYIGETPKPKAKYLLVAIVNKLNPLWEILDKKIKGAPNLIANYFVVANK